MSQLELDQYFKTNVDKAFEILYSQYYNMLCNLSLRITYDRSSAEDVVQEVLMELWRKRDQLDKDSSVIAYVKRSVYNRSLNFVKSKALQFESDDKLIHHDNNDISVVENLVVNETLTSVKEAVQNLPIKCRTVFALSRYEEKSYKEISNELGISVKTVENQISKALKTLRIALKEKLN